MAKFSDTETEVIRILLENKTVVFNKKVFEITKVAKPSSSKGEPKTDVYISLKSGDDIEEVKISIKQSNADFLENKMNADRAKSYFGPNWKDIVEASTNSIKEKFENKYLIFKNKNRMTGKGCITLGWKFELLNKSGGELSAEIDVSLEEVYKGISLDDDKKNAFIKGSRVLNSGIAEYLLFVDDISNYKSAQEIINSLILIDSYILDNPKVFFACKALNYRSLKVPPKWDGDRPLSVYVDWSVENGKLKHKLVYDKPLVTKGHAVAAQLKASLLSLAALNTDSLNGNNVEDVSIIN